MADSTEINIEILTGLARVLGYDPNKYESIFDLMFPIIKRDWESLGEDFEPCYGDLADQAGLDPETTIEYVLSITQRAN